MGGRGMLSGKMGVMGGGGERENKHPWGVGGWSV